MSSRAGAPPIEARALVKTYGEITAVDHVDLTVERFFLPEDLRRDRLGSRILAMAEEEGRRRGCTRAVLSTLHFQAPGFYLKQGWEVAARIDCEPPGHTRFYMTKKLY